MSEDVYKVVSRQILLSRIQVLDSIIMLKGLKMMRFRSDEDDQDEYVWGIVVYLDAMLAKKEQLIKELAELNAR